jgi:hypothetical protein
LITTMPVMISEEDDAVDDKGHEPDSEPGMDHVAFARPAGYGALPRRAVALVQQV